VVVKPVAVLKEVKPSAFFDAFVAFPVAQ
jgi:hypothetical protein